MGTGPLPHSAEDDDRSAANLVPLLGQMVVNHMLNMNPTEALYWGDTDKVMTAKAFLDLIHAPMPEMDVIATPPAPKRQPARPVLAPMAVDKDEIIEKRKQKAVSRAPATAQLHPSMIHAHLISDDAEEEIELTDHIRQRFEGVKDGPKAAFIVSFATMLVAPLIGVLLVIFNFMGGARLRQTAALAMVTALVTLAAELATQSDANATANAPQITAQPPHTAHL